MSLTWTLKLNDALSPAARAGTRALAATEKALRSLQRTSSKAIRVVIDPVSRSFSRVVAAAQRAGRQAGAAARRAYAAAESGMDMGAIGGAAGLAAGAGLLGFKGAKYIAEAQAFKDATRSAFNQILGGKEAGKAAFDMAAKTSIAVGADFKQSMSSMNSLLAQGFNVKAADETVRAMADLKTINPAANLEGITRAISQIKSTGRLQGDELMQLNEAGLSTIGVYEQIAKSMKLTDKAGGASALEQVKTLQGAGKISSETAIAAIMASIKKQTGGGEHGSVATARADKSMMGLLARSKNLTEQLIAGVNVDWSPFTAAVTSAMGALQSDKGAAMLEQVGKSLSSVMQNLFGGMGQGDFEAFFEGVTDSLKKTTKHVNSLIDLLQEIAPIVGPIASVMGTHMDGATMAVKGVTSAVKAVKAEFQEVGSAVALVGSIGGGAIGMLIALVGTLTGQLSSAASTARFLMSTLGGGAGILASTQMTDGSAGVGKSMSDGIVSGVVSGRTSLMGAMVESCQAAIGAARGALDSHSPSRKFFALGLGGIVGGLVGGVRAGVAPMERATGGMAGAAVGAADERIGIVAMRAGQRAASSTTTNDSSRAFTVGQIVMNGGGDDRARARGLASELRSLAMSHA